MNRDPEKNGVLATIVPIPGTRRVDHLEENLGATQLALIGS